MLLHLFIIPLSRPFGCSFFVRDCLKNITGILSAAQTLRQLRPIHDQYTHTSFKTKKESYYAAHEAELKQYNIAYHYLMEVHGSTVVDPATLKVESERLIAHRAKLQDKLEPMKPLLGTLRPLHETSNIDTAV